MGGGGERAGGTLEDGAQAVGSGEPLAWSHFPPLLQSSLASPLFCCQTCVQAQRAKPGASKVIFFPLQFFPFQPKLSSSSCSPDRQHRQFSLEAGGLIWSSWRHYLGVIPLSGSQFWLRGASTSQVRKAGTAAAHAVQSGGVISLATPSPGQAPSDSGSQTPLG